VLKFSIENKFLRNIYSVFNNQLLFLTIHIKGSWWSKQHSEGDPGALHPKLFCAQCATVKNLHIPLHPRSQDPPRSENKANCWRPIWKNSGPSIKYTFVTKSYCLQGQLIVLRYSCWVELVLSITWIHWESLFWLIWVLEIICRITFHYRRNDFHKWKGNLIF